MACWKVTITGKNLRKASVEKLVAKLQSEFDGASVTCTDATPPESRADRFANALSLVSDAKSEVESLRDELQEWHDGLPDNLQSGSKADELDSAVSELEDLYSLLEDAEGRDVTFPGMH